jgi:hypothetical protein
MKKNCGGRNISDSKMMRLELDMCGIMIRLPVKATYLLSEFDLRHPDELQ